MVKRIMFDAAGLSNEPPSQISNSTQEISSIEAAQKIIYCYLMEIVKEWNPEAVLEEFKHLFIQDNDSVSSTPVQAMYEIVFANSQEEFHYTLKRSCYIVVNNWVAKRKYQHIQKLIEIFKDPIIERRSLSPMVDRLRSWIKVFVTTEDYQQLELYAQSKIPEESRWSNRHTSYLLATQYSELQNPIEQREAAKNRAQQLKFRFKYDLAMYLARFESATSTQKLKNPTEVGDEVLRIIKILVAKRDVSNYTNLAESFLQQSCKQNYQTFKQSLQTYLMCYGESQKFVDTLNLGLAKKLDVLHTSYHDKLMTDIMLQKTCNKIIEFLTTENRRQPSQLLASLMSEGHPLAVVILLLKIVLICQPARTHLESCIAALIRYHEKHPQECNWMKNFIEIFNIIFAIYADNMLLQISNPIPSNNL